MQDICITNQPYPLNLTQKRTRRSRLPNHPRSNPFMETNHGHRY